MEKKERDRGFIGVPADDEYFPMPTLHETPEEAAEAFFGEQDDVDPYTECEVYEMRRWTWEDVFAHMPADDEWLIEQLSYAICDEGVAMTEHGDATELIPSKFVRAGFEAMRTFLASLCQEAVKMTYFETLPDSVRFKRNENGSVARVID